MSEVASSTAVPVETSEWIKPTFLACLPMVLLSVGPAVSGLPSSSFLARVSQPIIYKTLESTTRRCFVHCRSESARKTDDNHVNTHDSGWNFKIGWNETMHLSLHSRHNRVAHSVRSPSRRFPLPVQVMAESTRFVLTQRRESRQ